VTSNFSLRLLGTRWGDFLRAHLPGVGLGFATYGAASLAATHLRQMHMPPIMVCAGTGAVIVALMGLAVVLFPRVFLGFYGERFIAAVQARWAARRNSALSTLPEAGQPKP
jgi:hypothetical protein